MSIAEQKWQKFLKRARLFRFIPFVDFVLASGSLATRDIKEDSDFDVIVGVRRGRIFTARFGCVLLFGLFGWRAVHKSGKPVKDKFCFNHFVTPASYRLSPPYNEYWKNLYQKLVPVYGEPEKIQKFYDANSDWAVPVRNSPPKGSSGPRLRAGAVFNGVGKKLIVEIKECFLSGYLGDLAEKILKEIQIKRIEKSLKLTETYKPRIVFNDNELEFHPDTKRIEEYCNV